MVTEKFRTTFDIPEGYYVDEQDSKFRQLNFKESGIDNRNNPLIYWPSSNPTLGLYIPIKKLPYIIPVSTIICTEDIYNSDAKIPVGFEQLGFDTVGELHKRGIKYFLSSNLGYAIETCPQDNRVRIGLKKI